MLIASLTNNQLIYANEVVERQLMSEAFYCTKCEKPVILKRSKKGKYFFSHLTACGVEATKLRPIESMEHQQAKKLLVKELSQIPSYKVIEEKYFDSIQQTADIFIKLEGQNSFIYEYQKSIIPVSEVRKRQKKYLKIVDHVYWLLDYQLAYHLSLNSNWLQTMLNYSDELGFYVNFLNLKEELIIVKSHLPIIYQKEKNVTIEMKYNIITHARGNLPEIARRRIERVKQSNKSVSYIRELKAIMSNVAYREDIYLLYEQGIILSEQAEWIFTDKWQLLLVDIPSWLAILWALVVLKECGSEFIFEDFIKGLKNSKRIQLKLLPLICIDPYIYLGEALINLFVNKGFVKKLPTGLLKSSYW
ncbi:competence protein CoiA [Aerococcaceae bacterium WGS1372]